jgi:hypothetical protein
MVQQQLQLVSDQIVKRKKDVSTVRYVTRVCLAACVLRFDVRCTYSLNFCACVCASYPAWSFSRRWAPWPTARRHSHRLKATGHARAHITTQQLYDAHMRIISLL